MKFLRKFLALFIMLFIMISMDALAGWTDTLNVGSNVKLNCVFFRANSNLGYVAGANGKIYKTINGGTNWTEQTSGTTAELYSIFFVDDNNGFAVGAGGTVRKTVNGGTTWTTGSLTTQNNLYSISFPTIYYGYAIGTNTFRRTTNQATSGDSLGKFFDRNLYSIFFINESNGFFVGDGGAIFKTRNYGYSWSSKYTGDNDLRAVYFTSATTGYAVGREGIILKTTDEGESWLPKNFDPSYDLYSVAFSTDANLGWAVGSGGKILYTTDAGETWAPQISGSTLNLYSIAFSKTDRCTGYIASDNGKIFKTTNCGNIEPAVTLVSPNGGQIWHVGKNQTITWTSDDIQNIKIEYTTDNGATWQTINTVAARLRSYTWIVPNTPSRQCRIRVSDASNANVNAVSQNVFIIANISLTSPNGGENWQVGSVHNITWTSADIQNINIAYSTDNGTNWITIQNNVNASLGTYTWTIPNTTSKQCLVKITDASNSSIYYVSEGNFTIAHLTVVNPKAGDKWYIGNNYTITWTAPNISLIKIELTTDGTNWNTIADSVDATTGAYAYTAPDVQSTLCRIKITKVGDATMFDISGAFAITKPPFVNINAGLAGLRSTAAWGDYDNDGDLDLILAGRNNSGVETTKIYRNDIGIFTDINTNIIGIVNGTVAWGDYDNDGALDLFIAGQSASGNVARIYKNTSGGIFTNINANLTAVTGSASAWGDYDNDGDLDLIYTGLTNALTLVTKIYRNDGGDVFTDINANIIGVQENSSVAWGDYDNDGDLDILLTGSSTSGYTTKIYRNDAGTFADINASLPQVVYGSAAWGDYDSDGDLDILLGGIGAAGRICNIYRNDAGTFTDINAGMAGVGRCSVAWGDYDNDGRLDVLLAGNTGTELISRVYRNAGNGVFTDILANMVGVETCTAAWGDYDNDSDLDIILTGSDGVQGISYIFKNNTLTTNMPPATPDGLKATVSSNIVTLEWNKSTDAQTAQDGLTYNLRVGTATGGIQKYSPMANVGTGLRRFPAIGNTNQNTKWVVNNLPVGNYFWSVQAIDNSFAGSQFATEGRFIVSSLSLTAPVGGERYYIGSTCNITWTSAYVSTIKIEYSTDGGTVWNIINSQVDANLGTYTWTIPNKPSTQCKIRVVNIDNPAIISASTGVFTITPMPSITLVTPNGEESWEAGCNYSLKWTSNLINNIKIEYSATGAAPWSTIAPSVAAILGTYTWNVASVPTTTGKIRISDVADTNIYDESNAIFTVNACLPWTVYKSSPTGIPNNDVRVVISDVNNYLWVGTGGDGFARWDGLSWIRYNSLNSSLPNNFIKSILISKNSNKWIGTGGGLAMIGGTSWQIYNTGNSGLPDNNVNAIAADGADNKWLGTDKGLAKFDGTSWSIYTTASGLPDNKVLSIAIDAYGNKWVGTDNGLAKLSKTGTWTVYNASSFPPLPVLPSSRILSIAIDNNENIWFGTDGGGLVQFDGTTFITYNAASLPGVWPNDNIYSIAIDGMNNKWVGTGGGLVKLNAAGAITVFNASSSDLPDNKVYSLAINKAGYKWIGTGNGLASYRECCATQEYKQVTVLSPDGTESWLSNSNKNITWNSTNVDKVKIEYSTNSGQSWTIIASNVDAKSGSYQWLVPNNPSQTCRIRITDESNSSVSDKSNFAFTILDAYATRLKLTSPNGGEKWCNFGSTYNITWESVGVGTINLQYSTDNGGNWIKIESGIASTGLYLWNLPKTPSLECKVRVVHSAIPDVYDESDELFSITGLMLEEPGCNSKLLVGQKYSISWRAVDVQNVKLQYSTDNGSSWNSIIDSYPAAVGFYSWTVPNAPSSFCKIRIMDTKQSAVFDQNDGNFTINGIMLKSPVADNKWIVGSTHDILWESASVKNIKISYSIDNGDTWTTIISNTPAAAGKYSWVVPKSPSTLCKVKIQDADNANVYDILAGNFTITGEGIIVLSPNGGELWDMNTTQSVQWESFSVNYVRVEFSSDNGLTWDTINKSVPASQGNCTWLLPKVPSVECLVRVTDVDNSTVFDLCDNIFRIAGTPYPPPATWKVTTNTGYNATIIVPSSVKPMIGDLDLKNDDVIGIFYTGKDRKYCGGSSKWISGNNMTITVWGDNPSTGSVKDGFVHDELYEVRIWDAQRGIEFKTTVEFDRNGPFYDPQRYANDKISIILSLSAQNTINIPLPAGSWRLISTNILPSNREIETMMSEVDPKMEYMKDDIGRIYYPSQKLNTVQNWDTTRGYQIYMNETATLTIKGSQIDATNVITRYDPLNWYIIPFLPRYSLPVTTALSSIINTIRVIKDSDGNIYYPDYGINQIGDMHPGQGYKLNMKNTGWLAYPSIIQQKTNNVPSKKLTKIESAYYSPGVYGTGNTAIIIVESEELAEGGEIGIFDERGLLIGSETIQNGRAVIKVWGDNTATSYKLEGARDGEKLELRYWSAIEGAEHEIILDLIANMINGELESDGLRYEQDGIYLVQAKLGKILSVEPVLKSDLWISNEPNPCQTITSFDYYLPVDGNVSLTIYNSLGNEVGNIVNKWQKAGSYSKQYNTEELCSGIYYYRLSISGMQVIQKMIVLK